MGNWLVHHRWTTDEEAIHHPHHQTDQPTFLANFIHFKSHQRQRQQQQNHYRPTSGPDVDDPKQTLKSNVSKSSSSVERTSATSKKNTTITTSMAPDDDDPTADVGYVDPDADQTEPEEEMEKLYQLRQELRESKRQVYEREQQLLKLHREVHKLRSVLDHSEAINCGVLATSGPGSANLLLPVEPEMDLSSATATVTAGGKKKGVSGESNRPHRSHQIEFVWKDFDSRWIIEEALMDNTFLRDYLNHDQLQMIVSSMYEKEFDKDCYICRRGTYGSHLYVITYGQCEVIDARNRPVNQIGPGKTFGELALLYNCTRTASVKTLTRVRTWVLDRKVFKMIMMKTSLERTQSIKEFLKKVPLLQDLTEEKMEKIADAVEVECFPRDEYICRQGSLGDCFYIISRGSVRVTQTRTAIGDDPMVSSMVKEETIRTLSVGDYFGEQALLLLAETLGSAATTADQIVPGGAVRTANVISEECECFVLDQQSFFNLIGQLQEIKQKSYALEIDLETQLPIGVYHPPVPEVCSPHTTKIQRLTLDELENVTRLGMGGFGVVHLVRAKHDPEMVFAMKKCSKEFIRAAGQQQHLINEKSVMQRVAGKCQFLVRLYRTFQDEYNVYFLMETVLGGELWTVLRQSGPFNEAATRFYTGCVLEALQYLHSLNIVYRDLKPENCLLDHDGYLKLTDFGFAKPLHGSEKTWTFCGTPEYVAPEIILNRGHDRSVDLWSVGILIYELMTGMPPFMSADPLQTYHIILRGFDSIGFDEAIFSKHCVNIIRSLCRENPSQRLGVRGRNGYQDIKRHRWFRGFHWNNLTERKMVAPFVPKLTSNTDTRNFELCQTDDVFGFFPQNHQQESADGNNNNSQNSTNKSNSQPNKKSISGSMLKPTSWIRKSLSSASASSSKRGSNASGSPKASATNICCTGDVSSATSLEMEPGHGGLHLRTSDDAFPDFPLDWENYF